MTRRTTGRTMAVLAVVALLALSGCAGIIEDGGDATPTPTSDVTPTPTGGDGGDGGENDGDGDGEERIDRYNVAVEDRPAGWGDGIDNATRAVYAHAESLRGHSFRTGLTVERRNSSDEAELRDRIEGEPAHLDAIVSGVVESDPDARRQYYGRYEEVPDQDYVSEHQIYYRPGKVVEREQKTVDGSVESADFDEHAPDDPGTDATFETMQWWGAYRQASEMTPFLRHGVWTYNHTAEHGDTVYHVYAFEEYAPPYRNDTVGGEGYAIVADGGTIVDFDVAVDGYVAETPMPDPRIRYWLTHDVGAAVNVTTPEWTEGRFGGEEG